MRLSIITFAGTARTDVAVGTESDASILCTTRAATPRSGSIDEAEGVTKVGIGFTTGSAGVATGVATTGVATGATGAATTGVAAGACAAVGF